MKNGFLVFDSDMHIMEPPDLWQRYIAPEFRVAGAARHRLRERPRPAPRVSRAATESSGALPHRGRNFERNQATLRRPRAPRLEPDRCSSRRWTSRGSTRPVMFPSRALDARSRTRTWSRDFAAAIARAYNDWLHEFCQADPRPHVRRRR